MKYLIIAIVLIASSLSQAMTLTDLSVEYKHAVSTNRHWAIPEGEIKGGELNLLMRNDGKLMFTRAIIRTMFTNKQFRYGALEAEVGFKYKAAEIFMHHLSEHVLDYKYGDPRYKYKYPNSNSIGVRIKLN